MSKRKYEFEVEGFSISVARLGDWITCSAFRDKVLYTASWQRGTMTHCSHAIGSEGVERSLPAGLMLAFVEARALALQVP